MVLATAGEMCVCVRSQQLTVGISGWKTKGKGGHGSLGLFRNL